MEEKTLATEMLCELKASNRRWFIAFLVVLILWFATIGAFLWYISLPVDEMVVDQYTEGDANAVVGIGDLYGNPSESDTETQSDQTQETLTMPAAQTQTIKKLQKALLYEGELILITTSQFYSVDKHQTVTRYHIKKQIQSDDNRMKSSQVELFSSCSQIQITLFLRDYYYEIKGYEIPHDNPIWEAAKARYYEEHS